MLFALFPRLTLSTLIARIIVLVTAIPVHEYAHAWAAEKMGDPTARFRKRLSLNPLDHIDPIGALMILLLGVGFARPVPINSLNFKNRKKGIVVTSLAGPASNVLMALLSLIVYKLLLIPYFGLQLDFLRVVLNILSYMVSINLSLAVFNLLPIPPLDGWHAISQALPASVYWKIAPYEQQIVWVVLILVVLGVFDLPLSLMTDLLFTLMDKITFFLDLLVYLV
ncbi:MAG: site-2 protease family protein [Oscillospiraceae bacterium]